MNSTMTLVKEGNEELTELLAHREPGQKIVLTRVVGTLLENTGKDAKIEIDEVEGEPGQPPSSTARDLEEPEDAVVASAVEKAMKFSNGGAG